MRKPKPFRIKPAPYWETEEPQTATLKFGVIRFYPKAGKLCFCYPDYTDQYGASRMGKTVALHADDIRSNPEAKAILRALCAEEVTNHEET